MSTRAVLPWAACSARARLTATVVAPLPPLALTTVNILPRVLPAATFRWAVVRRTKASSRSVVVVGLSTNSRAPARIAFTMTCGWDMLPTANRADVRHFLVKQFNGMQRRTGIIGGDVHQHHLGVGALNAAQHRIGGGNRITGAGVHRRAPRWCRPPEPAGRRAVRYPGDDYD